MKSKFVLAYLLVLLIVGVSLVSAAEPVSIHLATWTTDDEAAQLQKIIDKINDGNTEYQLVHDALPSDYYTQVQTLIDAGSAADLLWMDQSHMSLAANGSFLALTDCIANVQPKTAGDVKDYYPGILQADYHDDALYGLPWVAQPVVVYYNKGMFDAAKLAYPKAGWTWDDFTAAAKTLTKDTNGDGTVDQWGTSANGWPPPQMFIWQAGGDVISPDLKTSPIDSPEALEGMEYYLSFAYNPEMAPSAETIGEQGFSVMFKAGKIGMFFSSASDDLDYNSPGIEVGVIPPPKNPKTGSNITYAWTASTVINGATAHPQEACDALLALSESIDNWKFISPRLSQATVEHLVASEPRKAANAQAFLDAAQNMSAFRAIPNYADWEATLWSEYFVPLFNEEADETATILDLAKSARGDLEALLPNALVATRSS